MVSFEASLLLAERAEVAFKLADVTADVVLTSGHHQLLIYVRAAKRQDLQKEARLLALGLSLLELDLSHLELSAILDKGAFRQVVLFDLKVRRWLHTARGLKMAERTRQTIQVEVDQRNVLEKEQKLIEIEARRQDRERANAEQEVLRARSEELRLASQAARVAVFEAQQSSAAAIAEKVRREALKLDSSQRAEVIVASIRRAIEWWGGTDVECQRCYLISKAEAEVCGYCASTGSFKVVSFTPDYLHNAYARMRSSFKPDASLSRAPVLTRELD